MLHADLDTALFPLQERGGGGGCISLSLPEVIMTTWHDIQLTLPVTNDPWSGMRKVLVFGSCRHSRGWKYTAILLLGLKIVSLSVGCYTRGWLQIRLDYSMSIWRVYVKYFPEDIARGNYGECSTCIEWCNPFLPGHFPKTPSNIHSWRDPCELSGVYRWIYPSQNVYWLAEIAQFIPFHGSMHVRES